MHAKAEEILAFWIDELGPEGWYEGGDRIDALCRERFLDDWEKGRRGDYAQWTTTARGALALLILLDQFPRNMFRGSAQAFASDVRARATAKAAIAREFDLATEGPARQFFYLPLMHSEVLADQDRSVRLIVLRFPEPEQIRHARAHRDIIRRFGRFPFRNVALGRASTPEEEAWLARGGYMAEVEALA
jgi:uncharacterized protein (DUF924 family)